ncbi:hypothetical protein AVEN_54959-1, partial [Araneus ventricosus]
NDKIYSITNQGQYAVRLDMKHENGTSAFARYENFWIENEEVKYKLGISECSGPAEEDNLMEWILHLRYPPSGHPGVLGDTAHIATSSTFSWLSDPLIFLRKHSDCIPPQLVHNCSVLIVAAHPHGGRSSFLALNQRDSISNHNGRDFYTIDQPNKESDHNNTRSGGWWVNWRYTSSLNGLNLYRSPKVVSEDGITWWTFGAFVNSLEATEIKVRPKRFH